MKSVRALVLIGCIALVSAGFTDEEIQMIKKVSEGCIEMTGIALEAAKKAEEGNFGSDPKLPEYAFCMLRTPGFIDDAGEYQIDVMQSMLGPRYGDDLASKVIGECTAFQGDKLEKALGLAKCLHENNPEK